MNKIGRNVNSSYLRWQNYWSLLISFMYFPIFCHSEHVTSTKREKNLFVEKEKKITKLIDQGHHAYK